MLTNPFSNGGLTDATIANRIDRIADIMQQKGQTHGQLWRHEFSYSRYEGGPVCLAGAIGIEAHVVGKPSYGSAMLAVKCAVGRAIARELPEWGSRYKTIHRFNDDSRNDVVKKLREIAASYRRKPDTPTVAAYKQIDFDLAAGSK